MIVSAQTPQLISPDLALPGRDIPMRITNRHWVSGNTIKEPFPINLNTAIFALGCFWGAERRFWIQNGVWSTAVGYTAGFTPNPSYEEVCSGLTGHAEAIKVIFDPAKTSFEELLKVFWQAHDPTQGMRQGNDIGTQYRSGIYVINDDQLDIAQHSKSYYQTKLFNANKGLITTEIMPLNVFYYAEDYHQQYLAKNPDGYCGLKGCGVDYSD